MDVVYLNQKQLAARAQCPIEIQVVEHALHESHAAPGGDLPVREWQLESHHDPLMETVRQLARQNIPLTLKPLNHLP